MLVLWMDCDSEGEAIAFDVAEVITQVNPHLKISRARFVSLRAEDINAAYANLVQLNKK